MALLFGIGCAIAGITLAALAITADDMSIAVLVGVFAVVLIGIGIRKKTELL